MPLPLTFSAPGSTHEPSIEDALQMGVWLALRADNVNAAIYSHKPGTPAAGVRIVMDKEDIDNAGMLNLPQQLVKVGFGNNAWSYKVTGGGEKQIQIVVVHVEKKSTGFIDQHAARVADVPTTANMVMARIEEILLRGTLFAPEQVTNESVIVDPFRSPTYSEDNAPDPSLVGAYNPVGMRTLNRTAPTFRRGIGDWFLRKMTKLEDMEKVDLNTDLGVAYFVFATYTVTVPDREDMTIGGFENA